MSKTNTMLKIMIPIFLLHLIHLYILNETDGMNDLIIGTISMFTFAFITLPLFAFSVIGSIIIFFTVKDIE